MATMPPSSPPSQLAQEGGGGGGTTVKRSSDENNDDGSDYDLSMSEAPAPARTSAGSATGPAAGPPGSASASPVRERYSLTLDQRRALRRWAMSQTVRPSHKACIEWFQAQFHQTISQSTVSHSLSPKYARLDGDAQLSGSRLRLGNWPDVEKLVLLWHQQVLSTGRSPTNEELADKAKAIFTQLPRYKDESPPEFSPGWIHRFKKRYGLLIRRHRRNGSAPDPASDIPYLVDAVPRFMSVSTDTSPAAIRDAIQRVVGVEATMTTCARVRDEIVRLQQAPPPQQQPLPAAPPPGGGHLMGPGGHEQLQQPPNGGGGEAPYPDEDPEVVLQNALRQLQQEEADAEAQAAAVREERERAERAERGLPPLNSHGLSSGAMYAQQAAAGALATPVSGGGSGGGRASVGGGVGMGTPGPGAGPGTAPGSMHSPVPTGARYTPHQQHPGPGPAPGGPEDLTLTPIPSGGPVSSSERPLRCPFCVNQRMLRTIKEAVEHMSTHVVV